MRRFDLDIHELWTAVRQQGGYNTVRLTIFWLGRRGAEAEAQNGHLQCAGRARMPVAEKSLHKQHQPYSTQVCVRKLWATTARRFAHPPTWTNASYYFRLAYESAGLNRMEEVCASIALILQPAASEHSFRVAATQCVCVCATCCQHLR